MNDSIPVLPKREWLTLVDVANGNYLGLGDLTSHHMVESFQFSVQESGRECDAKWDVNCVALAHKYGALPLASQLAVIEVCQRFWTQGDFIAKFDNHGDALAAHGAKFKD